MPREVGRPKFRVYYRNPDLAVHSTHRDASDLNRAVPEGLFIAESNRWNLWSRFPHAIAKMYALATDNECVQSFYARLGFSGLVVCTGLKLSAVPLATDVNGRLCFSD